MDIQFYESTYGPDSYTSKFARFVAMVDESERDKKRCVRSKHRGPVREGLGSHIPHPPFLAFADAAFRKMQQLRRSHPRPEDGGPNAQALSDWIAQSEIANGWKLSAMGYVEAERHLPLVYASIPDPWVPANRDRSAPPDTRTQQRPREPDSEFRRQAYEDAWLPRPRAERPAPVQPGDFPSSDRHLKERGLNEVPRGPNDELPPGSRGTYFDMQATAADPDDPGRVGFRTRHREAKRVVFRNMTEPDELYPGAPAQPLCICWQWTKDPLAMCRFGHGRRGGCFYLHRCSFRGADGWPCQNPFPCRAIEHYWQYVDTYDQPPRWYNPSRADLEWCATQEELRVLSRPQGVRAGEFTYAFGPH